MISSDLESTSFFDSDDDDASSRITVTTTGMILAHVYTTHVRTGPGPDKNGFSANRNWILYRNFAVVNQEFPRSCFERLLHSLLLIPGFKNCIHCFFMRFIFVPAPGEVGFINDCFNSLFYLADPAEFSFGLEPIWVT